MSRWKAASIHLSISICVGILVFVLLFGVWYPPPYFRAAGADRLILLLLGIDLTLGPLLTLIIFKTGKRGLKFDLTVIGIAQTLALIYGLHVIVASRPAFLVAAVDRFVLVSANELDDADLAQGKDPAYRSRSWTGPRLVAAKRPESSSERSDLLSAAIEGKDIERFPKYYADYASEAPKLLERAQPLDKLRPLDTVAAAQVQQWLQDNKRNAADVVWVPVVARDNSLVMLLDRSSGTPLAPLDIDPW